MITIWKNPQELLRYVSNNTFSKMILFLIQTSLQQLQINHFVIILLSAKEAIQKY